MQGGYHLILFTIQKVPPKHLQLIDSFEYERAMAALIVMLSPLAPHFASELWSVFVDNARRLSTDVQWVKSLEWHYLRCSSNLKGQVLDISWRWEQLINREQVCLLKYIGQKAMPCINECFSDLPMFNEQINCHFSIEFITSWLILLCSDFFFLSCATSAPNKSIINRLF